MFEAREDEEDEIVFGSKEPIFSSTHMKKKKGSSIRFPLLRVFGSSIVEKMRIRFQKCVFGSAAVSTMDNVFGSRVGVFSSLGGICLEALLL